MADIDKDLPNVDQELKIPSPEEIEVAEQEKQQEVDEQGNPRAIEMSFAREPEKLSEVSSLPHPLDQLNVPRKAAVNLRFFNS